MSYHHETWSKWAAGELVILAQFHDDSPRIIDFPLIVKFPASPILYWTGIVFTPLDSILSWKKDDIKQIFLLNTISLSHRAWAIFVLLCSELELLNCDFSLWFDQTNNLYLCTTSLDIVLGIPWSENCFPFSSLV